MRWSRLVLSLVVSACADGAALEGAAPDVDELTPALALLDEPWCEPFAERLCAAAERCGCEDAAGWPDDCVATVFQQCRQDLVKQASILEDGFLVARDNIAHCFEFVDEALDRCAILDGGLFQAECRLVVARGGEALPRAGERCSSGVCAIGLRCASDDFCRAPRPLGERCQTQGDCEWPSACSQGCDPDGMCMWQCLPPLPPASVGMSCGENTGFFCGEGAACIMSLDRACRPITDGQCQNDSECPDGQVCGKFDPDTGKVVCFSLPGQGEFCGDRFMCRDDLVCDFNSSFTCGPPAGRGERCSGLEIGIPTCAAGLACRDGICDTPAQLDEPCTFGMASCAEDLLCAFDDLGTPRCAARSPIGGPCDSDERCVRGAVCDFNTLLCAALVGEGGSCQAGQRCEEDLSCVSVAGEATCRRVDEEGDPCADRCPVGLRCEQVFRESTCVPSMCAHVRF